MSYYPKFSKLVEERLAEQDWSQSWLARRLGIHSGTVNRWLNHGTRPDSSAMVVRIADVLGIDKQTLLVAAGFGYQEAAGAAERANQPPPSTPVSDRQSFPNATTVDNRSGGIFFDGVGRLKIDGDVISNSTVHKTAASNSAHIDSSKRRLEALLEQLQQEVLDTVPETDSENAMKQIERLNEAATEPSFVLMQSVVRWFQKRQPMLMNHLIAFMVDAAVEEMVQADGEISAIEYREYVEALRG